MVRILIAEDDPGIGELMTDFLENAGWKTQVVQNGTDALAVFRNGLWALVLLCSDAWAGRLQRLS